MTIASTLEERFWPKVEKTESCWNWTAAKAPNGYGQLQRKSGTTMAHRIAYELCVGAIPPDLVLDHTCHNRACVNPDHLRAVTQKQNVENLGVVKRHNKSGFTGVSWKEEKGQWAATVRHNRKYFHVGYFDHAKEANAAAVAKRNELFTHNDLDRVA